MLHLLTIKAKLNNIVIMIFAERLTCWRRGR